MKYLLPFLLCGVVTVHAAEPLPLVLSYSMDAIVGGKLHDDGPLKFDATVKYGVEAAPDGKKGGCLHFTGKGYLEVGNSALADLIGSPLTVELWVKPAQAPPAGTTSIILTKRQATWQGNPVGITLDDHMLLSVRAQNGGPEIGGNIGTIPLNDWTHIALTHAPNQDFIVYVNGQEAKRFPLAGTIASGTEPLFIGHEGGGRHVDFNGWMDELRIYAAALTSTQIAQDMAGTPPPARAATLRDLAQPQMPCTVRLVRFDVPLGFKNRDGGEPELTRTPARRVPGPDAVDWPEMSVNLAGGQTMFAQSGSETLLIPRKLHEDAGPLFQQSDDPVITPGNHWLRGVAWRWGRTYTYTTHPTMRGTTNEAELWTFPIKIFASKSNDLRSVRLTCGGRMLYQHGPPQPPLNSLILLLPQNQPGPTYELSVNGSKPMPFDAGLQPVKLGDPRETPLVVDVSYPDAPGVRVGNLRVPEYNPHRREWRKELALLKTAPLPPAPDTQEGKGTFVEHLGLDVPRAPILNYTVSMLAGMSGGHFFNSVHGPDLKLNGGKLFPGTEDDYARFLQDEGMDMVFEQYINNEDGEHPEIGTRSAEKFMEACGRHGIRAGFNVPTLTNPNLPYYSRALPDFWLPKLRDLQLLTQRMDRFPWLVGFVMGADNAGYVPYWDWAPPIPNRPWAEAFLAIHGTAQPPRYPIGPECEVNPKKTQEYKGTEHDFLQYIAGYDKTFEQHGEFYQRLREVDPKLVFTNQSYGSSPGVLGDGGWPAGSMPARPMFAGLPVLQSYDWDETEVGKPMQNVALADRLRSYFPTKPLWALFDNFYLKYNREARQRIMATMLTRGPAAIGYNWLPQPDGPNATPDRCANEKEIHAWIHHYAGAYANTRTLAPVGILYVHEQAISRSTLPAGINLDSPDFLHGSHEGKTTEALFLCHAAGWPAKIITPEELRRGLPAEMKTILLTGLNRIDNTWAWSDGLEETLRAFVAGGGKLLVDDESVAPAGIPVVQTEMKIFAYTKQGDAGTHARSHDPVARLVTRNTGNITKLRAAMAGAAAPVAVSADPAVWTIPHRTGDTDFVTVTNWSFDQGKPIDHFFKPYTGKLAWQAKGPIYDVTASRKLTPAEASVCDLTHDAVRVYACPPGEVQAPKVSVRPGADGFYEASVSVAAGPKPAAGIPVALTVTGSGAEAVVTGATGVAIRLPVRAGDQTGHYTVEATELLAGQKGSASWDVVPGAAAAMEVTGRGSEEAVRRFLARHDAPLTVALTAEQAADANFQALAREVVERCRKSNRTVTIATIAPGELITGVQPYTSIQKYPQWQTVPSDLVLLGDARSNVLIYEQARGLLYPSEIDPGLPGAGLRAVTYSPFVGGYNCLTLFGDSPAAIRQALPPE